MDLSPADLDTTTDEILLYASNHDLQSLKPFLRVPGAASVQDPETGYTPLHAAIASCEATASSPNDTNGSKGDDDTSKSRNEDNNSDIEAAKATLHELLLSGAIWNDVDFNDETPACLAYRLGLRELYDMIVEAGVRAEMLMNLMGGYEELESDEEEPDESVADTGDVVDTDQDRADGDTSIEPTQQATEAEPSVSSTTRDVNSEDYLASTLTQTPTTLLDADKNGVMMSWETPIMSLTAKLLLPQPAMRVLNIGFGMGIIDKLFAETSPSVHHIIEAHPSVLTSLSSPSHPFGPTWQSSTTSSNTVFGGKWQDILPSLVESNQQYDAIYFDTFGESYTQLHKFFSEYVIALLAPEGRFSFFNGLGADRRVCYDVYCKVVELDLCTAGFDVEWRDVEVGELGGEGEGEWAGVRRRYWVLDNYRLPIITFMG